MPYANFAVRPSCRRWLVVLVAALLQLWQIPAAQAAASAGCNSINSGELNVEVAPGLQVTRSFALSAGETVGIFNRGPAGFAASITVAAGTTPMRTLHIGADAPTASFSNGQGGTFTFRLVAEQGSGAVSATCIAAVASSDAQSAETTFLTRRADRLAAEEPDRARLRRREPGLLNPDAKIPGVVKFDETDKPRQLAFSVSLAEIAAAAASGGKPASDSILDFWFEGRYGNFDASLPAGNVSDSDLGIAYVGAQFKPRPEIMLGTLAQFDRTSEADPQAHLNAKGSGWMAGPYASLQLSPGIFFDARAAWGLADNQVAAASGSEVFTTERQLVRGRLTGERELGAWRFAPSVGLSFLEESQRDAARASVPAPVDRGVRQGRIEVLPQVSYRSNLSEDTIIEPRATVGVFWNFDELENLATHNANGGPDDMRLKAEAGVAIGTKDGASLNASGGMEDGGKSAPDVWSGRLQLNVPLK
jgi:hypothetical protein